MRLEGKMLSLNEIGLLPSYSLSDIDSRSKVDPFIHDEYNVDKLPVFVSPMTSVIDTENFGTFNKSRVIPILPRKTYFSERIEFAKKHWTAFSLVEFEALTYNLNEQEIRYVLVDIANGHIEKLYKLAKEFKNKYTNTKLMIGNIANPHAFIDCCNADVDYVRVGIGGGSVCSTSVQCGVHASLVWMIEQIKKYPEYSMNNRTKIIADGGINTLDKAIKCLSIGYDYVMIGKQFAMCEEACGETRMFDDVLKRKYYGMASEQGQIDISGGCNKNPEGIETWVPVNTSLYQFTNKFEAALRSTMSYVGAHNLEELRDTDYCEMSKCEFDEYYK